MGKFKEYLTCGRWRWDLFSIKRGPKNQRWAFRNTHTNQLNYIKINPNNEVASMQKFLKAIEATPGTMPKTFGKLSMMDFAEKVISGEIYKVYVKQGHFVEIKDAWVLD